MNETVCRIVVGDWSWTLLVCSLRGRGALRVASRSLIGIARRVWVVHEVSLRGITCGILLLGRLRVGLLSALTLRLKDRVGEGRWSSRIGSIVRSELGVIVPKIEKETVWIVAIHHGEVTTVCDGGLWGFCEGLRLQGELAKKVPRGNNEEYVWTP
jgi:hypothetical protein